MIEGFRSWMYWLGRVVGEEAALAEVRARVLAQVRRRPQRPVWLAAAAMVALALLAGWLARRLNAAGRDHDL